MIKKLDQMVSLEKNKKQYYNSFTVRNIQIGEEYRVRIRTVNTQGVTSEFIQTKFAFTGEQQTPRTAVTFGEG